MRYLPELFRANREWARRTVAADPEFFQRSSRGQSPRFLWIGCADSRVPANEIVGLAAGELFVHRNIANQVPPRDVNVLSVLHYAVEVLRVQHVIVCGHYGCGGVRAAMGQPVPSPLGEWLRPLHRLARDHRAELSVLSTEEGWRWLCDLNVRIQVTAVCQSGSVQAAWKRGQPLVVHGWNYDLRDGHLRDLDVSVSGP